MIKTHVPGRWFLPLPLLLVAGVAGAAPSPSQDIERDPALKAAVEAQGRRLVEAINSADEALRTRVLHETFAPDALTGEGQARQLAALARLHDMFGALRYHHSEAVVYAAGETRQISLHVYALSARDSNWRDIQLRLEPAPPHRIRSIVFVANVTEPGYLPPGAITDPTSLDWLGRYVDNLVAEEDLAGTLLIAMGDRVIIERSFGFADSARTRRVHGGTRFNLASGGKMFTALLIARLVEGGRLRYDDPIATYVPELKGQPLAQGVTISHLLSHTSGIGEFWNAEYERSWHDIRTLRDYVPFVLAVGTRVTPGTRFEYSNSNYILAGLVVEAVTGGSYDEALAAHILRPVGMTATALDPFSDSDTLQAMRLRGGRGAWTNAPHGYRGSSAGGALTTSADMLRFARALVSGRIVSLETLGTMTTSKTAGIPGESMQHGYGFILERSRDGARSYGHGGIARGVNSELRYFPDQDITLIAFSNQDNGAYDDLRRNATRLITGER